MDYTEELQQGILLLRLEGNLDMLNAGILKERMMQAVNSDHSNIVLDLSNVGFVDSSGFGLLILINERLKSQGKNRLRIANVSRSIQQVFRISKISDVVDVFTSLDDAMK
jgi:anti-sigma B factor antagonist